MARDAPEVLATQEELADYNWNWPTKINRAQVQDLFRLEFVPACANAILVGGVGLGKTHLATALGQRACEAGHRVLFTTAVGMVNTLSVAHASQRLRQELRRYISIVLSRPHPHFASSSSGLMAVLLRPRMTCV